MKLILRLFLLIFSFLISAQMSAQSYEQVYLSDGSVLEGYICEQVPGSSVSVRISKATYIADSDSLQSSSERKVLVKDLPSDAWRIWVNAQPNAIERVALSNLKFDKSEFRNVLVLENGPMIRFLSLENTTRTFPWGEIVKIVREPLEKNVFSGLKDVITLGDGKTYSGKIVEQVLGKTIKIAVDDNSSTTVNAGHIASMQSVPISTKLHVLEQAALLDLIYLKGVSKPIEGVITLRRMDENPIVEMATKNGKQIISMEKVTKYGKVENPYFKEIRETELTPGEVLMNGKKAWFAQLEEKDGYFILGEEASAIANIGDKITIEANLENPNAPIYLIKAYTKNVKDGHDYKVKRDVFKKTDLLKQNVQFNRTSTPIGTTKVTFTILSEGDYIMYLESKPGYIIIHVEKNFNN